MPRSIAPTHFLCFFFLSLLTFWPALAGNFIWDDFTYILNNPVLNRPDALYLIWFSTENVDYWPLSYSILWAQKLLFGANPIPYHLSNLFLHAASCTLLMQIMRRSGIQNVFLWTCLFCLHPLSTQTVAWIFQLKTALATALAFASLLFFLKHLETKKHWHLTASVMLFAASLLSKGSTIMWPLILTGVFFLQNSRKHIWILSPFYFLSLSAGLLNLLWIRDTFPLPPSEQILASSWLERLMGSGQILCFYFWKSIYPFDLSFLYAKWEISEWGWAPLILVLFIFASLTVIRRTWSLVLILGLGYFAINLFPVLGFVEVYFLRYSWVSDHYTYLALPGLIFGTAHWIQVSPAPWQIANKRLLPSILILVIALFSGLSFQHSKNFQSEEILWKHALEKNPQGWMAHMSLGLIEKRQGRFEAALAYYQRALEIYPTAQAHYNIAVIQEAQGKVTEAEKNYVAAIELHPYFASTYNNLGALKARNQNYAEAEALLRRAIELDQNNFEGHYNLGILFQTQGDPVNAEKHFQAAEKIRLSRHGLDKGIDK